MASANPQQLKEVKFQERENSRGIKERFITGQHVSLQRLKEKMLKVRPQDPMMKYLGKEIPPYPTPVEFWVSNVAHVTIESGFKEIMESEEFIPGADEFLWWGLKINKEEIRAAEKRYMEENFPDQTQELNESFMEQFTKSPPFELGKSRYGNYCFTFPLTELMEWYKEQNCGGEGPVLRVYETTTYKQEIMYTILIHSPEDDKRFKEYPLLETNEWVRYQDGKIIWRAQAICETHWYHFVSGEVHRLNSHVFYVWDHVCLVFHLPNSKVLKIPKQQLINALDACEIGEVDLRRVKDTDKKECYKKAVIDLKNLKEE